MELFIREEEVTTRAGAEEVVGAEVNHAVGGRGAGGKRFEEKMREDLKAEFGGETEEGEWFERGFVDEGEGVTGRVEEVNGDEERGGGGPVVHYGDNDV